MRRALDGLASLLAPPGCVHCGGLFASELPLCVRCADELADLGPGPRRVGEGAVSDRYSAFSFEGPARSIVHAYKLRGGARLARPLAALIAPQLPQWFDSSTIVPVPTSSTRARARGFDQAELLAVELGRLTGRPICHLAGRRRGRPQTGTSRSERLQLSDETFFAQTADQYRRTSVVLLDDVCTTGVTLDKCASAITGQASVIYAVTFAATPRRRA